MGWPMGECKQASTQAGQRTKCAPTIAQTSQNSLKFSIIRIWDAFSTLGKKKGHAFEGRASLQGSSYEHIFYDCGINAPACNASEEGSQRMDFMSGEATITYTLSLVFAKSLELL